MTTKKVLIVDDDQGLRLGLKNHLESLGFVTFEAFDGVKALEVFQNEGPQSFDFVLLDVDMPRLNGLETLKRLKVLSPATSILMMTAYATIDNAVDAVKNGAFSYLQKPLHHSDLEVVMKKAMKAQGFIESLKNSAPIFYDEKQKIIGNSESMQTIFSVIDRLSRVNTPVLVRGESGTGKELVAKAIHYNSPRREHPFVAVNCSAISENLFESEFFGHEKGAFTGAEQRKIGKFQFADQGTLFLDELGDLSLSMQVKLLRVLQDKRFTPVGSNVEIEADVRIVAATNRNLDQMIIDKQFRDDLYYRLNVMPIGLPPLKDRINDLETLISVFVRKFNSVQNKEIRKINPQALSCLKSYPWPGNIRELENVIEHAFILSDESEIMIHHLPSTVLKHANISLKSFSRVDNSKELSDTGIGTDHNSSVSLIDSKTINIDIDSMDFQKQKDEFEKRFIIEALKMNKGKINQTALKSNIPKKTLLRKIEKYGIDTQTLK